MFKEQLIGDKGWTCQGGVHVGTKGGPAKGRAGKLKVTTSIFISSEKLKVTIGGVVK